MKHYKVFENDKWKEAIRQALKEGYRVLSWNETEKAMRSKAVPFEWYATSTIIVRDVKGVHTMKNANTATLKKLLDSDLHWRPVWVGSVGGDSSLAGGYYLYYDYARLVGVKVKR